VPLPLAQCKSCQETASQRQTAAAVFPSCPLHGAFNNSTEHTGMYSATTLR
jgi:hypothetical protein